MAGLSVLCYHGDHIQCEGPAYCQCECHTDGGKTVKEQTSDVQEFVLNLIKVIRSGTGSWDGSAQVFVDGRWMKCAEAADELLAEFAARTQK